MIILCLLHCYKACKGQCWPLNETRTRSHEHWKCLVFCHSFAFSELFGNQSLITVIIFCTVYSFIPVGHIYCFFQIVLVCNFWHVFSVECSEILSFLSQLSSIITGIMSGLIYPSLTIHKTYRPQKIQKLHMT